MKPWCSICLVSFCLFLAPWTTSGADTDALPSYHWSKQDLTEFSSASPREAHTLLSSIDRLVLPAEVKTEVGYQLGLNLGLRTGIQEFFAREPVTVENSSERINYVWLLQHVRAEWAIEILMDIALDERAVTSDQTDFESPEFRAKLERIKDLQDEMGYKRLSRETGFGSPRNDQLAESALERMALAGVPNLVERGKSGLSIGQWLRLQSQRGRLDEIALETWGDKAVLNRELGLSSGGRSGHADKPARVSVGQRTEARNGVDGEPQTGTGLTEGNSWLRWFAAGALVLAVAVFLAARRWHAR